MPIPINMSTMSANHMAVERLAGNNQLTEAEKIGEVSRHFESILLRQFLGKALQPMFGGGGMGGDGMNAATKGIYQDMITQTLADTISKTGEFGLAQAFHTQLMPRNLQAQEAAAAAAKLTEEKAK
ncbi:MAG: hypothetical protein HOH86_07485 [Verrucomicrobiales bacterium]|jgi:Rod binding domain-containing protein|nr:hypothetical protein [Verrucomicrobiales bacterium]|tara:strand:+ start:46 stop:423 length:378 start_codon:yes stop_codon:yes gene_type:complete